MRKEFTQWCETVFYPSEKNLFFTGDLGFNTFEKLASLMGPRFINVGVAEQNLINLAAACAKEGLMPLCYTIAPFAVFRPYEQIRINLCLHHLNVKIVGNGGGYGYGMLGATHHALEDIAVLSALPQMKCYIPLSNEDVSQTCDAMMQYLGPSYLRLGAGSLDRSIPLPPFAPIRQLKSGSQLTVLALGPSVLNALEATSDLQNQVGVFVVSEMPLIELSKEFLTQVQKTGNLLIVEEHTQRGGLAELVCFLLAKEQVSIKIQSLHAKGYPSHRYGSQRYHQKDSGLDAAHIKNTLYGMLHASSHT